jgi:hypothetical protein
MGSKFDELCNTFEQAYKIREEFKNKLIEIFSVYMECNKEQITLDIGEPKITDNATEFDATLKLELRNSRILEVSGISFISELCNEDSVPQRRITYKGISQFLDTSMSRNIFDNIYESLLLNR